MNVISNKQHYILNLISQYGSSAFVAIIGFISAPLSLNYWKTEQYGIWAIVTSLATYFAVTGLGIDTAAGILMTKSRSLESRRIIFQKSMVMVIFTTAILIILLTIINITIPNWIRIVGKMSDENYPVARKTAFNFLFFFLLNLPFSVIRNSFAAYQRTYLKNLFGTLSVVISFATLIVVIITNSDLPSFAFYRGISVTIINILMLVSYFNIRGNKKSINEFNEDRNDNNHKASFILKTGIRLTTYGLAVMLSVNIGNLIISNTMSVSSVTPFSLSYKLLYILFSLIANFNLAAAPLLGREFGLGNWKWIEKGYGYLFILTVTLSGLLCIGGLLFMKDIIYLWVGNDGFAGIGAVTFLCLYFFLRGLVNLNYVIINAFNYTKRIGMYSWLENIIMISVSLVLITKFGIATVAFGLFFGTILTTSWILPLIIFYRTNKRLKYDLRYFGFITLCVIVVIPISLLLNIVIDNVFFRIFIGVLTIYGYVMLIYKIKREAILSAVELVRKKRINE